MLITDKNPQIVIAAETQEEFRDKVNMNDGARITTMTKFDDLYFGIKTLNTRWSPYSHTSLWMPEKILDISDEGMFIIGMMKFDKLWTIYQAANTGITSQEIAVFDNVPDLVDYIIQQWKKGMDITDLYNDNGNYYIVTSSGLNWEQSLLIDPYPENEINEKGRNLSFITELMPLDDKNNLWVFSGNTGYNAMAKGFISNKNIDSIQKGVRTEEGFNDGYRATLIRSVLQKLFIVLLK
ncbi:MAG: hypothetical protein V2I47_12345 [Bacteroidales bacterium]|jgi:hypothetical protein|nr:hypothetical protein [Bacteroidales bacterium]